MLAHLIAENLQTGVNMKIFCGLLVKDEADIIKSCILDMERWADRIFVMDNGSTDGTWEIVQSLAGDIVVPWKQDAKTYCSGIRSEIFNNFKDEVSEGDWWCYKCDADEFYLDTPKEFLAKVPKKYSVVAKKSLDFVLTPEDAEGYEFTGDFEKDRAHVNKIKNAPCWSEPRFFRYRKSMQWVSKDGLDGDRLFGEICPDLILVKHYQCRSPKQMQHRLDVRNALSTKKAGIAFNHVKEKDWHELLCKSEECLVIENDEEARKTAAALPFHCGWRKPLWKRLVIRAGIILRLW